MEEILPGVLHWTALHPKIKFDVSSYYALDSRTLIDPLTPDDVLAELREHAAPERIVLTNRHHLRESETLAAEFGCPILCHEAGLHEFAGGGPDVDGFAFGDELGPGVQALEVGVICDEESAVLLTGPGALCVADGVMNYGHTLAFVPDQLIGDDPEAIKAGLRRAYTRIATGEDFDALLLAHGDPIPEGGREALRSWAGD
jgi:hypothetical protein